MAKLTLSMDEKTIERARIAAQAMGSVSINTSAIRLSGSPAQRSVLLTMTPTKPVRGQARGVWGGWKFNREEANERG